VAFRVVPPGLTLAINASAVFPPTVSATASRGGNFVQCSWIVQSHDFVGLHFSRLCNLSFPNSSDNGRTSLFGGESSGAAHIPERARD
jgi:hypothetical protein